MCTSEVNVEARDALAELLRDICAALCPENPDGVVIGPVDFGTAREAVLRNEGAALSDRADSRATAPTTNADLRPESPT